MVSWFWERNKMYSDKSQRSTSTAKPGRIFIVGASGSGKSLFANALARALQCSVAECSDVLISRLARIHARGGWAIVEGNSETSWERYIRSRKEAYREQLSELGDQLTEDYAGKLLSICANTNARIIVGARRANEARDYYFHKPLSLPSRDQDTWILFERPSITDEKFDSEFYANFCNFKFINTADDEGLHLFIKEFIEKFK